MVLLLPLVIAAVIGLILWLRPWPFFLATGEARTPNEKTAEQNVAWAFGKWVERQAHARGLSVRGVARPTPLECPKCRKSSNYFVYPDEVCERCWRASLKPVPTTLNRDRL